MAMIFRDVFARQELHREVVRRIAGETCAWCGQVKTTRKSRGFLYRYRVETDTGRCFEDKELFCSVQCRRSYYD